jgi:hypothetical protein
MAPPKRRLFAGLKLVIDFVVDDHRKWIDRL